MNTLTKTEIIKLLTLSLCLLALLFFGANEPKFYYQGF